MDKAGLAAICDAIIEGKRWRPFSDRELTITRGGLPLAAFLTLNDRRIHLSCAHDLDQKLAALAARHHLDAGVETMVEDIVYHLFVHEYNHHHYCPNSEFLFQHILDGLRKVVEKREIRRSNIRRICFDLHNMFADTVINAIESRDDESGRYRRGQDLTHLVVLSHHAGGKLLGGRMDEAMRLFLESNLRLCGTDPRLYREFQRYLPRFSHAQEQSVNDIVEVFLEDGPLTARVMEGALFGDDPAAIVWRMCDYRAWNAKAEDYARIMLPYWRQEHEMLNNAFTGKQPDQSNAGQKATSEATPDTLPGPIPQSGPGANPGAATPTDLERGRGNEPEHAAPAQAQAAGLGEPSEEDAERPSGSSSEAKQESKTEQQDGSQQDGERGAPAEEHQESGHGSEPENGAPPEAQTAGRGKPSEEDAEAPPGSSSDAQRSEQGAVDPQNSSCTGGRLEPGENNRADRPFSIVVDEVERNQRSGGQRRALMPAAPEGAKRQGASWGMGQGSGYFTPGALDYDNLNRLYQERAGVLKIDAVEVGPEGLTIWRGTEETDFRSMRNVHLPSTVIIDRPGDSTYIALKARRFPIEIDARVRDNLGGLPDLCFVFDSSASMRFDPAGEHGEYHIAILTVYSILNALERHGIAPLLQFNAINFSDQTFASGWCHYRDLERVKRTLLEHQGGGTTIEVKALAEVLSGRKDHYLLFLLSDLQITNFQQLEQELIAAHRSRCVAVTIFKLGGQNLLTKRLEEAGITVHFPEAAEDFMNTSIKITQSVYAGAR